MSRDETLREEPFLACRLIRLLPSENGGEPIAVVHDALFATSRQTADYLLCANCEDLLNEQGERWVIPKLAKYLGPFPLYDLVTAGPHIDAGPEGRCYLGVHNPEIDLRQITHFAMGIYFKAAVHPWSGSRSDPRINLGPYADKVRQYLIGGAFPENVSLSVILSSTKDAYIGFNEPYEAVREHGHRLYLFCVPGVWFYLMIGKHLLQEMRDISITGPDGPITVSSVIGKKGQEMAIRTMKKSRRTRSYREAMKKVEEWKKGLRD